MYLIILCFDQHKIEAQLAKIYKNYKNTRLKLLKITAAIWCNKICKTKQLAPKYCSIKIYGNNRQNVTS
jgi:hypothetical protein